jgi:hypothetical protein
MPSNISTAASFHHQPLSSVLPTPTPIFCASNANPYLLCFHHQPLSSVLPPPTPIFCASTTNPYLLYFQRQPLSSVLPPPITVPHSPSLSLYECIDICDDEPPNLIRPQTITNTTTIFNHHKCDQVHRAEAIDTAGCSLGKQRGRSGGLETAKQDGCRACRSECGELPRSRFVLCFDSYNSNAVANIAHCCSDPPVAKLWW